MPDQLRHEGEQLLSRREVAERLGVHPRTVARMICEGRLPDPFRLGGKGDLRWRESDIDDWIAAGCPICDPEQHMRDLNRNQPKSGRQIDDPEA
jgi:excisionase family DNA binding protein